MLLQFPFEAIPLLYLLGYIFAVGITVAFVVYIIRNRRNQPAAQAFAVISLCLSIWAVGYVGRMFTPTLDGKLLWTQVSWIGITVLPVAVFVFVLLFTGWGHLLTRRRIIALLAIPASTQVLLATNDYHGLFYESVWLYTGDTVPFIASVGGTWFYGVHIPYSWGLYFIGTVLLLQFAFLTEHIYRSQTIGLIVGALLPWIVNGTFLAGIRLHPQLDPTPVGFAIGMTVIGIAVFRTDFLGLIPVARDHVLSGMDDCIFVLDESNRLIDVNPAGETFLDTHGETNWCIGDTANTVFPSDLRFDLSTNEMEQELEVQENGSPTWYLRRQHAVEDTMVHGRIIKLTNITGLKQQQQELEAAHERIEIQRDSKDAIRELLVESTLNLQVEESICRLLVEEHECASAWVVQQSSSESNADEFIAIYGDDNGFLQTTNDPAESTDIITNEVLESGDPLTVSIEDDAHEIIAILEACDLYSIHSYPLVYDGVLTGALTCVRTAPPERLDTELFAEFADALAFKQHIYQQRAMLTADVKIELEIRIADDHVLGDLSTSVLPANESIIAHELVTDAETGTYLLEIPAEYRTKFETVVRETEVISSVKAMVEREEKFVYQVELVDQYLGAHVYPYGGIIKSMSATNGTVDITIQFPPSVNIREFANSIQTVWPTAQIRSQYEQTVDQSRNRIFESLTEKQEVALHAAVIAGFFDRPQGANATEVAETLDVSRSTFLHHLRTAERKIFTDAFQTGESKESVPENT